MGKALLLIAAAIIQCLSLQVNAGGLMSSGRSEVTDNPFVAYGYNPMTNITTGYLAALRIAPGRTDECELVFSSNTDKTNEFRVRYIGEAPSSEAPSRRHNNVYLVVEKNVPYLRFAKKELGRGL